MKKKIMLLIFFLFCTFILFSCTKIEVSEDPSKAEQVEFQNQEGIQRQEETQNQESNIEKKLPKGGEAWGKDAEEFKGITSVYPSPAYGNLAINIKGEETPNQLSLLCVNEETGTIYYVNFGQDNYIYQLEGDKSTLLIEEEANFIQFWRNEIYFLKGKSSYPDILLNVYPLYKYNLDTREIVLVIEEEVIDFCISTEGIYYRVPNLDADYKGIRYLYKSFEKDTVEEVEEFSHLKYRDYQLGLDLKADEMVMDIFLKNIHTKDTFHMASDVSIWSKFSIAENILFFTNINEIYGINLENGKKSFLFLDELLEQYVKERPEEREEVRLNTFRTYSYTVMNGKLYIIGNRVDMGIISFDMNTQEVERFEVLNTGKPPYPPEVEDIDEYPRLKELFGLEQLFTSGNRLFALSSVNNLKNPSAYDNALVELVLSKDGYYVVRVGLE